MDRRSRQVVAESGLTENRRRQYVSGNSGKAKTA
jgi:hypothetical protein